MFDKFKTRLNNVDQVKYWFIFNFMSILVIALSLLFFLGHVLNWFFIKTKVPDLLVLVSLGFIFGPEVLGIVQLSDLGKVGDLLSTMALVVILYEGGLQLSAKQLLKSSLPSLVLSLLTFLSIASIGTLFAYSIGQSLEIALLLGVAIGSTSSAIVIPMVKPLDISEKVKTILSLESAFTDVLAIVIFLVLADSFAQGGEFKWTHLFIGIGPKTLMSLGVGIGLAFLWAFVKKRFESMLQMAFASEAWVLFSYGCIELLGYNGAIGVFAIGFTLANLKIFQPLLNNEGQEKELYQTISKTEKLLLSEVTFLLRTFFFLYLGMLIEFKQLSIIVFAFVLTLFIFLTRFLSVKLLFIKSKYSFKDALIATAMGPRGLACAVLATIPLQRGIAGGEWLQMSIFSLIPFTILFTAIFVILSEKEFIREKFKFLFKNLNEKVTF